MLRPVFHVVVNMAVWHPRYEGIDHINIYSKSSLPVGRALSNFFPSTFLHPEYGKFNSVEGFYYYLLTGQENENLRELVGLPAKTLGRALPVKRKIDKKFKQEIQKAITYKIIQNPYIQDLLIRTTLPLAHYYYYGDPRLEVKIYDQAKEHGYMIEAIEEIRHNLQKYGKITTAYNKSKRDSDSRKVQLDVKGL